MTIPDSYWSTKPPTKPGWFLTKIGPDDTLPMCMFLDKEHIDMGVPKEWLWCRLVPAQEVQEAWQECCALGSRYDGDIPEGTFLHSRAKRVMEGEV